MVITVSIQEYTRSMRVGQTFTVGDCRYRVTASTPSGVTISLVGPVRKEKALPK